MPEPVVYIRGYQLPLSGTLTANKEMMNDLKTVASIDDDQVWTISQRLSQAQGFLDPATLLATIREAIDDLNAAEALQRVLRAFTPSDIEQLIQGLEKQKAREDFPFEQENFNRLKKALQELIKPYPGLVRYRKAERLAKVTGDELESVELICDLRPIFDENRVKIEGVIPYTRLRVITTGADGLPKSFEAELTRQEVDDLAEKANNAKQKLDILYRRVQDWLPGGLPDLPQFRMSRKDSKDD